MARAWRSVSSREPCQHCGKPDYCSVSRDGGIACCRRVAEGGMHRIDRNGADYWLHYLPGGASSVRPAAVLLPVVEPTQGRRRHPRSRLPCPAGQLSLSPHHRRNLQTRGLPDGEIIQRGYRTWPRQGRAALARGLVERFGADVCRQVPGLYLREQQGRRWWSVAGAPGLAIPLRDHLGRILGFKVRSDDADADPKYTTISSTKYGGPGPGAPVHVPHHTGLSLEVIRVTEGELKADVATVLTGILTLSIPGVSAWRAAIPVLQHLQPRTIRLAFDADWRTNPVVARALAAAAMALTTQGWSVVVEVWDPAEGKGIDDVVAAGHRPVLQAPVLSHGLSVRAESRVYHRPLRPLPPRRSPDGAHEPPGTHTHEAKKVTACMARKNRSLLAVLR